MKKFLILAFAAFSACFVHAQIPKTITVPKGPYTPKSNATPDVPCLNQAGTFVLGQKGFGTQSNDLTLDTIWLCRNDSIFINHNGDFNLSGDPNPGTQPGVGYAFYTCPPTITGPTLQHLTGQPFIAPDPGPPINPGQPFLPGDPCRLNNPPPSNGLLYVASGNPNGDTWFFNSGFLQTTFGNNLPLLLHFAPITFDDATNNGYETSVQGNAPGECVNVNTASQFEVVYLNAVDATGITTPFAGNSCLGRFKLGGGYPEWDPTALYTVDIYLKSNPSIKALIHTPPSTFTNNVNVVFSAPQPGIYVITIEDGKSCGFMGEVDMGGCLASDQVTLDAGDVVGGPGETVCVPITTSNFTGIQSFSTSIQWDPTVLELASPDFIQNINNDLTFDFDPVNNSETSLVSEGFLGISYAGSTAANLTSAEILMEVCFNVLVQVDGICSPITFTNEPTTIFVGSASGQSIALVGNPGSVCVEFNPLVIDIDTLPLVCGSLLSSYTLSITGEEPPYEIVYRRILPTLGPAFSLDTIPANTPATLSNLQAGTYQIIVTPQNGVDIANADTIQLVVVAPLTLGLSLDLTSLPQCSGDSTGSVSANVLLGGTPVPSQPGFTFQWSASTNYIPSPASGIQVNVPAGTYSVTVTQTSTGCTAVASGTLGNPAQLINKIPVITPASCTGLANGCFTYEMQGGTPFPGGLYTYDFQYSQVSGGPYTNTEGATTTAYNAGCDNLSGFYFITATDANGCVFTEEFEVTALRTIELMETVNDRPSCFGGSDGELGVNVVETPAAPGSNFTFSWTPSAVGAIINNTTTTSNIIGIPAGAQLVTAIDQNGCSDTLTLFLGQPTQFSVIPLTVTNPTCVSPNSGSISVLGFGGTGLPNSFTYNWGNSVTGSSISSLSAGTYTVTVSDANQCTAVFDTTLALPAPPAISNISVSVVKCGSDGSLTAIAPTATNFLWTSPTNNVIPPPANNATISGLTGGTYVVLVTDANFCTNTDTITLDSVVPLTISNSTVDAPSCFGYTDGSISVGTSGGTGTPNFKWSTPPPLNMTATIFTLGAGTYTVTATDANMCTATQSFTLANPPQIAVIVNYAVPNQVSCFGECDGEATLLVNYPLNNNFNFNWSDNSTDSVRIDLCAGATTVTITETSTAQCFVIDTIIVGTPTQVTINALETIIDTVTCNGLSDGGAFISGDGGNGGPYTFVWQNGTTGPQITDLAAGNYPVTITDKDGCTGTYTAEILQPAVIIVTQDPALTLEIVCFDDETGELGVSVTGGNIPSSPGNTQYTFVWSDGSNQLGNTNPLKMLAAGIYTVTVTDTKGCTGTASLVLQAPSPVIGNIKIGPNLKCFGDETTITVDGVTGGQGGPYSYTIDYGVPIPIDLISSISGGTHYITFIDQKNCETLDSTNIEEPEQIVINFNPPFVELNLGDSIQLSPQLVGRDTGAIVNFEWMPADFVTDPTKWKEEDEVFLYTFQSGQLMLTVTDSLGCTGKGTLNVEVDLDRNIYIPNVFIPNDPGNGLNRLFAPGGGTGVEQVNFMQVYDRWGTLMFETKSFQPERSNVFTAGWDGRYKGKFVNPGVYVYAIEVLFVDGKKLLYRGDVTVVR
jgi:hypothetical protein